MALSNMRKEPQRELTESALGIAAFVAFCAGDWWLCSHLHVEGSETPVSDFWVCLVGVPIAFVVLLICGWGLLMFTHAVGESVCDWAADLGFDPRPRKRR